MSKGEATGCSGLMAMEEIGAIADPLGHSWKCTSLNCSSSFCQEIKKLTTSSRNCTHSCVASHDCEICKDLLHFVDIHSEHCKEAECDVFKCRNNPQLQLRMLTSSIQALVDRCNVCAHDVETDQGWYCKVCPKFDVCHSCYMKEGIFNHPHKLTTKNEKAGQEAEQQLRLILGVLVHTSKCQSRQCHTYCHKMRVLFRHGKLCQVRSRGGCPHCIKMWNILKAHAEVCKELECSVPRCKDLKEYFGF